LTGYSGVLVSDSYHVAALHAEAGDGGGEAEAARPGLPPRPRLGSGGDDGGAVWVDERRPLEEGDGRERRVVCGAEHGAFHLSSPTPAAICETDDGGEIGGEARELGGL
jgi:hypothetical protein